MLLAQYERQLLKAAGFLYPLQLLALAAGMYFVIKTGLEGYTVIPPLEEKKKLRSGLLAGLIWTYLMVQGCAFLHEKIRWLEAVGSFSLELYLCHMFVFYHRVVNDWLPQQENVVQIVAAATIAVALAWVIHMLFDLLWKAAAALSGEMRADVCDARAGRQECQLRKEFWHNGIVTEAGRAARHELLLFL